MYCNRLIKKIMKHKLCPTYCKSNARHIRMIALTQVYKFINNTVGNNVPYVYKVTYMYNI